VYSRCLDPSFLAFSLSLCRHPSICILFSSRFTSYKNNNNCKKVVDFSNTDTHIYVFPLDLVLSVITKITTPTPVWSFQAHDHNFIDFHVHVLFWPLRCGKSCAEVLNGLDYTWIELKSFNNHFSKIYDNILNTPKVMTILQSFSQVLYADE
jgi:hypothetical protein